MTDTFHSRHFNSIQALRGITALFIVLEHVRFLNCGAFGVDIFFCISGFMAMFSTHQSTKHFIRKRFIRIYPLYALLTIGTFLLLLLWPDMFQLTKANPETLLKSLTFIPFEISEGIIQPLIRVGWTVNYEIFFYLLFALSFRISHKYRGLICSGFLCLLVLTSHILPVSNIILTFYGDYIQFEFIFGIIAYYIVQKMYQLFEGKRFVSFASGLSVVLVLILFIILAITKQHVPLILFGRSTYWGLPAFIIVLLTFIIDMGLKTPKALILLGNISFSIFLIHYYPIMFIDRKIYSLETFSPMAVFITILGLILVIAISYISYLLIEKKLSSHLRKFIK